MPGVTWTWMSFPFSGFCDTSLQMTEGWGLRLLGFTVYGLLFRMQQICIVGPQKVPEVRHLGIPRSAGFPPTAWWILLCGSWTPRVKDQHGARFELFLA